MKILKALKNVSFLITNCLEIDVSSENDLKEIKIKINQYIMKHGYEVKSWFKDFDKYHNGVLKL